MSNDSLIVISHYAKRGDFHLKRLLSEVSRVTKSILVVINSDFVNCESEEIFEGYSTLVRPNLGMNIGGWNAAFHRYPNYGYYIFLQDECSLLRHDFLDAYKRKLNNPNIGIVGESINFKWDKSWRDMLLSPLNYSTDIVLGSRKISRVENYVNLLHTWKIEPGFGGRHLRALVWGIKGETLIRLEGFPIGETKEQCIASEIAVSKKIEQLGLRVCQMDENPFTFFRHEEWRADGFSKL